MGLSDSNSALRGTASKRALLALLAVVEEDASVLSTKCCLPKLALMRFRVDVPVVPATWKAVDGCAVLDELWAVSTGTTIAMSV